MKKLYILLFTILISSLSFGQSVFINEIHYDNAGTDSAEGLEIAGPAGTDLSTYTVSAYNGNGGAVYNTQALSGTIPDEGGTGYGAIWFAISGLQNGAPDGLALDNGGTLIQFLSYEGSFTATDGPANTVTSTDIGVAESSSTPAGNSIQLTGSGTDYSNFSWTAEVVATSDAINTGQTFGGTPIPTLTLLDADPSGSTVTVGPEDLTGDFEFAATNFIVGEPGTGTEGDGYISWQILNVTDGGVHDSGIITDISAQPVAFNTLLPDKTYQVNAILKDNTDADLTNPEAAYTLTANTLGYIDVTSVADLRAVTDDGYYRLTNEAFLTFQQSFRGQKFIQDATGGILIDDVGGVISSTYAVNDGITNIRGQVSEFGGMKQFVPSTDYGAPSSSGNIITPQTVTLAELTTNAELYESELVEVVAVTIDNSTNTTFLNGQVYAMSQSSDNFDFRTTFFDVDYIDENVPTVSTDVVGIINERSGSLYFLSARDADDISGVTLSNDTFEENNFRVYPNPTSLGYVTLSSKNSARMNVSVFDILGKQVLKETVSNNTLNVSSLTSGVYIMNISQDNARITKKLVIQ